MDKETSRELQEIKKLLQVIASNQEQGFEKSNLKNISSQITCLDNMDIKIIERDVIFDVSYSSLYNVLFDIRKYMKKGYYLSILIKKASHHR